MKKITILLIGALMSTYCFAQIPTKTETVSVNGKNIYYEVYGKGKPLFLLHGYTASLKSWPPYVDDYIDNYEVYLIDLNGHGKSDTFTETLSIKTVAEDLNALILYLKLEKIKAIGFSYGGDVLYQLSLINPYLIESMVTIGSLGSWNIKDYPEVEKGFTYDKIEQFSWIRDAHRNEDQIIALFEQFKNYSTRLSDDELKRIKHDVLIVSGDDDSGVPLEEVARARRHLQKSDLWILPNVSNGAHEGKNKKEFIRISKAFLSKK